jgi:hypothetical protein
VARQASTTLVLHLLYHYRYFAGCRVLRVGFYVLGILQLEYFWLNRLQLGWPKWTAFQNISGACSRDDQERSRINVCHQRYLSHLVGWIVLDDAQGIDPQILLPELLTDGNDVPDSLRKGVERDSL